jgi:hypothetical protein
MLKSPLKVIFYALHTTSQTRISAAKLTIADTTTRDSLGVLSI